MMEEIWKITGFITLVTLMWVAITLFLNIGVALIIAARKRYGEFRREYLKLKALLEFLDEADKCRDQFAEWLAKNYPSTYVTWALKRMRKKRGGNKYDGE